jgi:hypothetical protein
MRRPQGSHSIESVGTRKSDKVWALSRMLDAPADC